MEDLLKLSEVVRQIIGETTEVPNLEEFIPPDGQLHLPVEDFKTLIKDVKSLYDSTVNVYRHYQGHKLLDVSLVNSIDLIEEFVRYFDVSRTIVQKIHAEKYISEKIKERIYGSEYNTHETVFELCIKYNDVYGINKLKAICKPPIYECIVYGNLELLKTLEHKNLTNYEICRVAATYGNLECLKFLRKIGYRWDKTVCEYAALNGHLECLKYAHENGCPWDEKTCEYAAQNGHLQCLKYAHAPPIGKGCPWTYETCNAAGIRGHLDCLKYAHSNGCPLNGAKYFIVSLTLKQHECLKYVVEHIKIENSTIDIVYQRLAEQGQLEMMQWFYLRGYFPSNTALTFAAREGHLDCVTWLCEQGCKFDVGIYKEIIMRGQLNSLKWLHEREYKFYEDICTTAAEYRMFECLKWLYEKGYELTEETFISASTTNRLDILKWLYEKSCPWDEDVCAATDSLECLQWLHEKGCPWNKKTITRAVVNSRIFCLEYACNPPTGQKCPIPKTIDVEVLKHKDTQIIKYLIEAGVELDLCKLFLATRVQSTKDYILTIL